MKNMAFLITLPLILMGCASGNCRSQKNKTVDAKADTPVVSPEDVQMPTGVPVTVRVYKYDGSKQCGMGKAVPVEKMQKELGSIKVYRAESKHDGQMHITLCGSPTGQANVYEIEKKDLEEALKKGFKEWKF